jgi:hypothetical protein
MGAIMPHENDHAAHHVERIANAILEAKAHDPLRAATGLAFFSSVLVEDDQAARTTVALVMLQLALELDPDLGVALRWN